MNRPVDYRYRPKQWHESRRWLLWLLAAAWVAALVLVLE